WRFLDLGRRLERAATLVRLLRTTLVEPPAKEAGLLEALLEVADSGITYRRRYLARLQAAPLLDLLLTDDSNPRGLLFQLRALVEHLTALPPSPLAGDRAERAAAEGALEALRGADIDVLA